jgi:hypothetical protein
VYSSHYIAQCIMVKKYLINIWQKFNVGTDTITANFAPHALLTLAPPSGYALNLKALIKVSKVSWISQLTLKYLDLHLKENLILQTSFLRKNASQKPASFRFNVTAALNSAQILRLVRPRVYSSMVHFLLFMLNYIITRVCSSHIYQYLLICFLFSYTSVTWRIYR